MTQEVNEETKSGSSPYSILIRLAFVAIEFFIVKIMSSGYYTIAIGWPSNHTGNLIYIVHFIVYMILVAAGFVFLYAYWSDKERTEKDAFNYKLPVWLIVSNICALLAVLALIYINKHYYSETIIANVNTLNPVYTWAIILSVPFKIMLLLSFPLFIAPIDVWRRLFQEYFTFPVKLLLLAIMVVSPYDKPVAMYIGSHLAIPTIRIAQFLYKMTGREFHISMYDDAGSPVISEQTFTVVVTPTCSGYEGVTLILLFLLLFLPMLTKAYTRKQVILIGMLCLAATFFMNSIRIALMVYIGEHVSDKVAVNGFHTHFGIFSLLMIACICMAFVAKKQIYFNTSGYSGNPAPIAIDHAENEFLLMLPLVVTLGTSIIVGMFEDGFNWLYPAPILLGTLAFVPIRSKINFDWRDIKIVPVLMGIIIFIIWIILVPTNKEYEQQFMSSLYQYGNLRAITWLCLRVIGSSIFIPIAEELAFRSALWDYIGYVFEDRVAAKVNNIFVLIVTSVIFGVLHSDITAATIAGLGYGALRLYGYGVYGSVIAHIVTNSLIAICVIAFSAWSYW